MPSSWQQRHLSLVCQLPERNAFWYQLGLSLIPTNLLAENHKIRRLRCTHVERNSLARIGEVPKATKLSPLRKSRKSLGTPTAHRPPTTTRPDRGELPSLPGFQPVFAGKLCHTTLEAFLTRNMIVLYGVLLPSTFREDAGLLSCIVILQHIYADLFPVP